MCNHSLLKFYRSLLTAHCSCLSFPHNNDVQFVLKPTNYDLIDPNLVCKKQWLTLLRAPTMVEANREVVAPKVNLNSYIGWKRDEN